MKTFETLRIVGGTLILCVVFIVAIVSAVFGQTVTVTSSSPPEALLAAIQAGKADVPQSLIRQFGLLLDDLDLKCKEDRRQIGDMAVKGVRLLSEKSVTMTLLKFLQSMNASMPKGVETLSLSCAEVASILIVTITR